VSLAPVQNSKSAASQRQEIKPLLPLRKRDARIQYGRQGPAILNGSRRRHRMSSPSVCSRREPSTVAQDRGGRASAAQPWVRSKRRRIRPIGAGRMLSRWIEESSDGARASHRPGTEGLGLKVLPGLRPPRRTQPWAIFVVSLRETGIAGSSPRCGRFVVPQFPRRSARLRDRLAPDAPSLPNSSRS
jgi:hypothetical protein